MTTQDAGSFATATLLPALGRAGASCRVEAAPVSGTRSSLYLLRVEELPPLLMRCFRHRRQAARNVEALRHLESLNLPAPRLVFQDLPRVPRRLTGGGACVTVETWVEGTPVASLVSPDRERAAALKVAQLLARLHAVTRDGWGPLSTGRLWSFASYTLLGARRMVRRLQRDGWLESDEADRALSALEAWREPLSGLATFSLVHNDANRHNFIVTPSGDVMAVDVHRLGYEPSSEEVVNALYHFCRHDPELAEAFERTYFERAGAAAREAHEAARGFFEPLNYLKRMHRRASVQRPSPGDPKMARWKRVVATAVPPAGP